MLSGQGLTLRDSYRVKVEWFCSLMMWATLSAASATVVVMSYSSSSKVWSRKKTMAVSMRPPSDALISSDDGSCIPSRVWS